MSQMPAKARYAAIFVSQRSQAGQSEYADASARMLELAKSQPGFVQVDSARGSDGLGITVSYWESLEAIHAWGRQIEHVATQKRGRDHWYDWFDLAIARIDERRRFQRPLEHESENIERDDQEHQADDKK